MALEADGTEQWRMAPEGFSYTPWVVRLMLKDVAVLSSIVAENRAE